MMLGSMLTLRKCVEVAHCRTFPQLEPRPRQQLAPEDCQDLEKKVSAAKMKTWTSIW